MLKSQFLPKFLLKLSIRFFYSGLRKSEVLSLQWKDIDFEEASTDISKTLAVDEFGKIVIQ